MMTEKSRPFKSKTFICPIYGATVHLTIGDEDKLIRWIGKKNLPIKNDIMECDGFCRAYEHRYENGKISIEYHVHIGFFDDFTTLAHELIHLVNYIFKDYGIPFSYKNDESIAYYQGFWIDKLKPYVSSKSMAKKRKTRRKGLRGKSSKS